MKTQKTTRVRMILALLATVIVIGGGGFFWKRSQGKEQSYRDFCLFNLRDIKLAKETYQSSKSATNGTPVTLETLGTLLTRQNPICPKGGIYSVNPLGELPTCSYTGGVWIVSQDPRVGVGKRVFLRHELPGGNYTSLLSNSAVRVRIIQPPIKILKHP